MDLCPNNFVRHSGGARIAGYDISTNDLSASTLTRPSSKGPSRPLFGRRRYPRLHRSCPSWPSRRKVSVLLALPAQGTCPSRPSLAQGIYPSWPSLAQGICPSWPSLAQGICPSWPFPAQGIYPSWPFPAQGIYPSWPSLAQGIYGDLQYLLPPCSKKKDIRVLHFRYLIFCPPVTCRIPFPTVNKPCRPDQSRTRARHVPPSA